MSELKNLIEKMKNRVINNQGVISELKDEVQKTFRNRQINKKEIWY